MFGQSLFDNIMFGDDDPDISPVIRTVYGTVTVIGVDVCRSHADLLVVKQ
jgi:hypothetical protein